MKVPRHHSALILASLVPVVAFVGATAYTENELRRLDTVSTIIETNSVPSIQYLARAETRLGEIRERLHDALGALPPDAGALAEARSQLDAFEHEIDSYLRLQPLEGERDLWNETRAQLSRARDVVRTTLEAEARGDTLQAQALVATDLDSALDQVGTTILQAMEFDVGASERLARQVRDLRQSTRDTLVLLDAVATAIAAGAAFIAYRASRQHDRLLQAHNSLLAARVDELDRFAGRVAHDILSPLGTIGVGLRLLAPDTPSSRPARVERMERALKRVHDLVDGLLTFARSGARPGAEARCRVEVALANVTADCAQPARERDIELLIEPCEPIEAACSIGVLTSVMQNLVRNAIKYMGDGPERRVAVRVRTQSARLRLEVADTGPGIPEALHETIFDPFVRGPHEGAEGIGLGLATVRRFAEAHGGAAGVRSASGEGAVFWVELPLASRPPATEQTA